LRFGLRLILLARENDIRADRGLKARQEGTDRDRLTIWLARPPSARVGAADKHAVDGG
jgi:hypothetical protein